MTTQGQQVQVNVVPADDVWFNLEFDDDVDPMSVVTTNDDRKRWKYLGPKLSGKRTFQVKLVRLGCGNLYEAKKKTDEMGCRLVEGQARKSFTAKFREPDAKGLVVFGGSQWRDSHGDANVVCLYRFEGGWGGVGWNSNFHGSDGGFSDDWRWLVAGM